MKELVIEKLKEISEEGDKNSDLFDLYMTDDATVLRVEPNDLVPLKVFTGNDQTKTKEHKYTISDTTATSSKSRYKRVSIIDRSSVESIDIPSVNAVPDEIQIGSGPTSNKIFNYSEHVFYFFGIKFIV